jgi:hypothetical protein
VSFARVISLSHEVNAPLVGNFEFARRVFEKNGTSFARREYGKF